MDNTPQFQGQNNWNPPPPPFPQSPPPLPPQQKQSGGAAKTCLIILLVVFAIIGVVLSTLIVLGIFSTSITASMQTKHVDKAKIGTARSQIQLLDQALDNYKLEVGTYPSDLQGLVMNIDQSEKWNGPYLKTVPLDPWGYEYQYYFPGEHGVFDLCSLGADGMEGGEGINADITNWW